MHRGTLNLSVRAPHPNFDQGMASAGRLPALRPPHGVFFAGTFFAGAFFAGAGFNSIFTGRSPRS